MTNLDHQAAEAMGAFAHGEWYSIMIDEMWIDGGDVMGPPVYEQLEKVVDWSPTTKPEHWWIFVQFMKKKGWNFFYDDEWTGFDKKGESYYKEDITSLDDMFRASVQAGLAALRGDEK